MKSHTRTPRKIQLASGTLTPEANEYVRGVMREAKRLGRKFVAKVTTSTIDGQTVRQVEAWHTRRPPVPKCQQARCGAQTRAGGSCQARVCLRANGRPSTRCRMHGGLSTGPSSEAGREAIRESNRRRAQLRGWAAASS